MKYKIPLYLVSGFLGSGKTTLLENAVQYFTGKKKLAIIQNEFAPANFDGKQLRRSTGKDFDLLEVNNGSVFCVCLLSGFIDSLSKFLDQHNPEIVLMEASGLSDTVGIGEVFSTVNLRDKLYLAGNICIVDAKNFLKISTVQTRVRHQVMMADFLLVNKTDMSDQLYQVMDEVAALNPFAKVFQTKYCDVPMQEIFEHIEIKGDKNGLFLLASENKRPDISAVVLRVSRPVKHLKFDAFISEMTQNLLRFKGYVLLDNGITVAVNAVYGDIKTAEIKEQLKQSELVAIDDRIDLKSLKHKYLLYT